MKYRKDSSGPAQPTVHIPTDMVRTMGYRPRSGRGIQSRYERRAIDNGRSRLGAALVLFALCFVLLAGRMIVLAGQGGGDAGRDFAGIENRTASKRADIVDRNGVVLATSLRTASLYANARKIIDPDFAAEQLVTTLPDLDRDELRRRLHSDRAFVWLKRNLTPRQQYEVNALGIPALGFVDEERRVYPQGEFAGHVLGYVDVDNNGIAGVEKYFDAELGAGAGSDSLRLTLDVRVQHALRDELLNTLDEFEARAAAGLVLDIESGEILALSSLPDFDPNDPGAADAQAQFNRMTLGVYESGSTFKVFTTAMALESGVTNIADQFDATKPLKVSRYLIRDSHPKNRWLSVPEVFIYSSNIGAARMALEVGPKAQRAYLERFGLTQEPDVELPERGTPLLPKPWGEISTMTVGFGHGIAVTPLQLAAAAASITNGGYRITPTLLPDKSDTRPRTRIVSAKTSAAIRALMRLAVEQGTGSLAAVDGYRVGGKTGTAEKASVGGYTRKALLSSFVAIFPSEAPRYLVFTMFDEPKGKPETYGNATGGWVAAPAAGNIVARIGPILGVEPRHDDGDDMLRHVVLTQYGG